MMNPLIRKLEQFEPLSAAMRAALEAIPTRLREYRRGEQIVQAGDRPEESCVLLVGCVFRYKMTPTGGRQIVSLQVPGDFVDLHSFVLKPIDHSVAPAVPSTIARVPHDSIERLLRDFPTLSRNLMWDLALDAAIAREWMVAMGQRPAAERIAHLICELYLRLQRVNLVRDHSFEFALTQQDIGDLCGISAVHVNRSLQALRADNLLAMDTRRVTVVSLERLLDFANFDSAYLHLLE
jgi:CRP-like cAMP-binding protein